MGFLMYDLCEQIICYLNISETQRYFDLKLEPIIKK